MERHQLLHRIKFLVLVFWGILPFSTFSQVSKAEMAIQSMMQSNPIVGLSVAVVKNNRVVYQHSFGLKDQEQHTALTDDCLFRIASISKSFSATAIMQLVEANKISLEDDVSKLLGFRIRNPRFPDVIITLRMLLSHRSSLHDSQGYFNLDVLNPEKNPNWAACYNQTEPGKGYLYCNLNFNLAGTIIERVSGERFDQYIKRHILQPLRIDGGYCVDSLDKSRFATIYEYSLESMKFKPSPAAYAPRSQEIAHYIMGYSTPIFSPTGGMKISTGDLARYMIMHSQQGKLAGTRIISKRSSKEMQTALSEEEHYGLALLQTDRLIEGKTLVGHTGSAYGLESMMFFHPKEKFGLVVISNGCHPEMLDGFNAVLKRTANVLYDAFVK
ncbi:serine hydrolase domain-containing protein [Aquirufa rosea]|uniref:Class A beta-lactamase-related serine hydrolase n=1 Tax=Aquirufa rosea TaxID=2509241 RepID=A0A4Q1C0N8_9BACT|nr:serine hydrolase domain-containing protein [Aquirufa rosea]RXK50703.1 class A beta-lactamase-related serine hydrolase [Aquirufa rosea]